MTELNEILKTMKNRKTPGCDNLNRELLKYASTNVKLRFLNILNLYWITHRIPEEWSRAKIKPVFKKGDRSDCNNCRGICLLTSAYKVRAKIITRRLNVISEASLHEEQHGFRKGRSCSDLCICNETNNPKEARI
jgi:hypothetical protein